LTTVGFDVPDELSFCYFFQTEHDVSVRQRAVDLLYAMCDRGNVKTIVAEMLSYLEMADYATREEMVSYFFNVMIKNYDY
jgi:hypothetical protein